MSPEVGWLVPWFMDCTTGNLARIQRNSYINCIGRMKAGNYMCIELTLSKDTRCVAL